MKKGDIVKLINPSINSLAESAYSNVAWIHVEMMMKNKQPPPTLLVVKDVGYAEWCGMVRPIIQFDEMPGKYTERHFELAIPAGEPDVEQLMKESREVKRMLIGF